MVTLILSGFIGWMAGILVNYLADVLPTHRQICVPFCIKCEAEQRLANYFLWPRRCDACGAFRGLRTLVVEILFAGVGIWLWISPPARLDFGIGLLLMIYFGLVVVVDLEHRLILHPTSLAGSLLTAFVGIGLHGWQSTLWGGVVGFGIMFGLYWLGIFLVRLLNRVRNQELDEEALGFGDVILGGVMGLLLGWPGVVVGLVLAILLGGIASLVYLVVMVVFRRYQSSLSIPYGPFLIGSAFILIFFKNIALSIL